MFLIMGFGAWKIASRAKIIILERKFANKVEFYQHKN